MLRRGEDIREIKLKEGSQEGEVFKKKFNVNHQKFQDFQHNFGLNIILQNLTSSSRFSWFLGNILFFSTQSFTFYLCVHFQISALKKAYNRSQVYLVWIRANKNAPEIPEFCLLWLIFESKSSTKIIFSIWKGYLNNLKGFTWWQEVATLKPFWAQSMWDFLV